MKLSTQVLFSGFAVANSETTGERTLNQPIDIRPKDLKIVQDILCAGLPGEAKVWVFGSRARWTTKASSDLDLAIDAGRPLTRMEIYALADAFEDSDLPYRVDVLDLCRVSDGFKAVIEAEKVALPFAFNK